MQLNPAFVGIFSLGFGGFGRCDIIVLDPTIGLAGTYQCIQDEGFDPPMSAQLTVIGRVVLFRYTLQFVGSI